MMLAPAAPPPLRLADLPNLSPALAEELHRVGICDTATLLQAGAESAWLRLRAPDLRDSIQPLLALEGAITGLPWRSLPWERHAALLRFFAAHRRDAPPPA